MKETTVEEIKKVWNVNNDYFLLDSLVKNLRENDGKNISDFLHLPIHFPFIKRELKGLTKDSKILEAGCGFGHWVFWLAEQGYRTVGVDLAEKTIATAKNYSRRNKITSCNFIEADIRQLPIKDNYFDLIFSFGVIEHFQHPESILNEFKRVLKPGGRIFLSMPNQYSFHTLTRPISKMVGRWNLGYERSYSQKSLKGLLKNSGFEVLRCGIMPGGELFGCGVASIPYIGRALFRLLSKFSFYIENHQSLFGFWLYGTAEKQNA